MGRAGWAVIGWILLGCVTSLPGAARQDPTRAALRARIALLQVRTARSADRTVVVSGPQAAGNALLLDAALQIRERIETLLGLPLPREGHSVRLQVIAAREGDSPAAVDAPVRVRVVRSAGERVYRIVFDGYGDAYRMLARERVIYTFLLVYCTAIAEGEGVPRLPSWLWQGVCAVLDPDERIVVLERVMQAWRAGQLPTVTAFFQKSRPERLKERESLYSGALIDWLATRPSQQQIWRSVFARIARSQPLDAAWIQGQFGVDVDEQFDRWLLAQRRTIRGVGTVTAANVRALQAALLLYPGRDGIPRSVPLGPEDPLVVWYQFQDRPWLEGALRHRQQALQQVAQGRAARFQELVAQFVAILDGVLAGQDAQELRVQEAAARAALEQMDADVRAAGGIWRASD